MSRPRYSPRPTPEAHGHPFATAEEAWFWAITTYDSIGAGARAKADRASIAKPCDARDVMGVIARLHRARRIEWRHLDVLFRFGRDGRPPDPRVEEERSAEQNWRDALARLTPPLQAKGIVACCGRRSA